MKRIWKAVFGQLNNFFYQKRAVKHVEKIALGKITSAAPIHQSERKYYDEIQKDKNIRKELSRKDGNLVNNVNKFNIKTGNVVVTRLSERVFPTRESEWAHRDDTEWEYGFYELPLEKIPKGKLLFREALEILHLRQELLGSHENTSNREELEEKINNHPASKRVSEEHLDRIWQYFRPFGKVDKQDVISISQLEQLDELLSGKEEVNLFSDVESGMSKLLQNRQPAKDKHAQLDKEEEEKFLKEAMIVRFKESERLKDALKQIKPPAPEERENKMDEELKRSRLKEVEKGGKKS